MKDSFKSSSVMGLNWIYDSDSLPGRMSWKMPPGDKTEWAFERSQDTASARISAQLINFFKLKSRPAALESSPASGRQRNGNKVFEAPGGCEDKTARPAHHGAASVLFFCPPPLFSFKKEGLSSQVALTISISWNYHFTCLQGPYRWLMCNGH